MIPLAAVAADVAKFAARAEGADALGIELRANVRGPGP